MDEKQREQFREAVERKNEAAAAAGTQAHEDQPAETDESQDTQSVRQKSTGHGKKTADKWNQRRRSGADDRLHALERAAQEP